MIQMKNVIDIMNEFAPPILMEDWDKTGFQLGSFEQEVKHILLVVDVTPQVVDEAIEKNVDMIISHHSLFFIPPQQICSDTIRGQMIYKLIKNDIAVFSAHTNLDNCANGVNDALAKQLEMKNLKVMIDKCTYEVDGIEKNAGLGRVGDLATPMKLYEFGNFIKEKLACKNIRIYGDKDREIKKAAVCGGSGIDYINEACKHDVDLYITGDIRSFEIQSALELGLTIVDANHYETEKVVLPVIKEYIMKKIHENNLTITISEGRIDDNAPCLTI